MVFDVLEEVLEAPDCFEPEAEREPDSPVVAAALPSVDDAADSESVEVGASVIVPVTDSSAVEEGAAESDEPEGDDVRDGSSEEH